MNTLNITLSFDRFNLEGDRDEQFSYTFTSNESLGPILEKMEMFLASMGFVVEGRELQLVDKRPVDTFTSVSYNSDNVKPFPTPFNQE